METTATILLTTYHLSEIMADLDNDGGSEILLYTWKTASSSPTEVENQALLKEPGRQLLPQSRTIDLNRDGRLTSSTSTTATASWE